MAEEHIPLSRPRLHDPSKAEVNEFNNKIAMIHDDYLQNIVDGYSKAYRVSDKEAKELLQAYISNRKSRNDIYFETFDKIQSRLFSGKPIILIKKKA